MENPNKILLLESQKVSVLINIRICVEQDLFGNEVNFTPNLANDLLDLYLDSDVISIVDHHLDNLYKFYFRLNMTYKLDTLIWSQIKMTLFMKHIEFHGVHAINEARLFVTIGNLSFSDVHCSHLKNQWNPNHISDLLNRI